MECDTLHNLSRSPGRIYISSCFGLSKNVADPLSPLPLKRGTRRSLLPRGEIDISKPAACLFLIDTSRTSESAPYTLFFPPQIQDGDSKIRKSSARDARRPRHIPSTSCSAHHHQSRKANECTTSSSVL